MGIMGPNSSINDLGLVIRRNTLSDVLRRTRHRTPHKLALVYQSEAYTYAEFDDLVNQTAHLFQNRGITCGHKIAVLSKNSLDFAVVHFALARVGAVMVPINYMLAVPELAYILQHAGITGFLASQEYALQLDQANLIASQDVHHRFLMDVASTQQIPAELEHWLSLAILRTEMPTTFVNPPGTDSDVANILYTSGTESRPKGVMLSHHGLISEYVSCIVDGHMSSDDVAIHALPLYHSAQLHCFLGPSIYVGSTGIILPNASPSLILDAIERYRATQLFCPPTVWISLLRQPDFKHRDLSSLRKCYYGAAIMPCEVLKELTAHLPLARFWNFYGQTEVAPLATVLQPEDQFRKLGSAGKPALNVETKIVDDAGREVAPGQIGEIVHRTSHVMVGYLHDEEKTREAFQDGWFHSGDLGYMDDEGYLTVVDRKKDMIKTGGINVSSREVEEILYQHPAVGEAAVIGVPDDFWIEAVTAVIVRKAGMELEAKEIIEFCEGQLSKFKIPKHVVFKDELPKNPSGKILKRELRLEFQSLDRTS